MVASVSSAHLPSQRGLTPAISGAAQQARAIAVCWESVRLHRVLRWLGSSHLARSLCRFRSLFAESGARLFGQVRDRMFFLCSGRCFLDIFSGSRSLFFTGHVLSLFEAG